MEKGSIKIVGYGVHSGEGRLSWACSCEGEHAPHHGLQMQYGLLAKIRCPKCGTGATILGDEVPKILEE
ncbi:MAG: hypothetical protein QGG50_00180 [Methanopyri archaeon]|jgi:hypothetical protein|nr:hypothetical protein [Methanopyri archaeon]